VKLPPHKLIKTAAAWQECLQQLKQSARIAIDLEANSMYAYQEEVCLIQITIPGQDFIIDPLAVPDISEFEQLLTDPEKEKVFHAAEYDLILLKRQFDWEMTNLFDTMWAARVLGYKRYGLASLLEDIYDIHLDKRFQKSNWCKRPLSTDQLLYAQLDTHYLLDLRDYLQAELQQAGRWEEAVESFAAQTQVKMPDTSFDPADFWSINGVQHLDTAQQTALQQLYIFREEESRDRNVPPFKVMGERTLLALAEAMPQRQYELRRIHGMSNQQVRRYGRKIVQVIRDSRELPPPAPRRRNKRPSDPVLNRYDKLHTWRKKRGKQRGVESDVILSRDILWELAHLNPSNVQQLAELDSIGEWRCQKYGAEIIELLNG